MSENIDEEYESEFQFSIAGGPSGEDDSESNGEGSYVHVVEICRMLQLMCEGHFTPMQVSCL